MHSSQDVNVFDGAIRSWTLAHQTAGFHAIADWVSRIGSVSPLCWLAVVVAAYFAVRRRRAAAAGAVLAPVLAVVVYLGGKRFFGRLRPPSPGAIAEATNSFPSAHATTSAAVCCALAYVLWRERIVGRTPAMIIAIVPPLIIGASRVYLDVHWATDVLAGWTAGILIAALGALAYNQFEA